MKSKFSLRAAILAAALLSACDMMMINDPAVDAQAPRELSENERDGLEKNGHFLKLVNMPPHTQAANVYSVSVSNSSSAIGKLDKNKGVSIYRDGGSCTLYLPLVYNDGGDFLETGFFYAAFTVHVDALTKFVVGASDFFVVSFTDGRGQADASKLPSASPLENDPPSLTVYNLPETVSVHNFSKVFVYDLSGAVARCDDYSQIALSVNGGKAAARIPLHYYSLNQAFSESGVFFVSFDVNVDAETRYTLTPDDKVKVSFVNGNGYMDILNMPDSPVPRLAVTGLPLNAAKHHASDVSVYGAAGPVAGCPDYKNIVVVKYGESSTFLIPLSYSSGGGGYFRDSGRFAVSFAINVDIDIQIVFSRGDNLFLSFTDGSAEFDVKQYVKPAAGGPSQGIPPAELTEAEKELLEKTGRYLKLLNLPPTRSPKTSFPPQSPILPPQ